MGLIPRWAPWTFPFLVASSLFALLHAAFGTIDEYADGAAVVRIQGRSPLVQQGETAASRVPDGARFEVIAVVPWSFRPRLRPGMPLRVHIAGCTRACVEVPIETIGDRVAGPTEIRRYLPADLAEALSESGPVVLVTASLASGSFSAEGRTFDYRDGMRGRAEVRVGSRSVLFSLVPGLESIF